MRRCATEPQPSAIDALRAATNCIHARLHAHPVFAPLQAGTIDRAGYVDLLMALHGFHSAFIHVSTEGPARCRRLAEDISFLGVSAGQIDCAPSAASPGLPGTAARWGTEYVLRGASLGGRILSRHLDGLLGVGSFEGRQFFIGKDEAAGTSWRCFITQLELALPAQIDRQRASDAAIATFVQFENWMSGHVAARATNEG